MMGDGDAYRADESADAVDEETGTGACGGEEAGWGGVMRDAGRAALGFVNKMV